MLGKKRCWYLVLVPTALAAFSFACSSEQTPVTGVMVIIDAEDAVRQEAASLLVVAKGGSGQEGSQLEERYSNEFEGGAPGIGWPRRVAIMPQDADANRIFEVVATAKDKDGDDIGLVRAVSGFVAGKTLELHLLFEDSCRYNICRAGKTCHDGDCISADIEASELPEYKPGQTQEGSGGSGWVLTGSFLEGHAADLPSEFALSGNYPNPFNANTLISYELPTDAHVKLEVYNISGQKVATVVDGQQEAGYRSVIWDASEVSSGVYFYKLTTGDFTDTRRMMLVK